ncbi:hypothetical protein CIB95_13655 [Lottiidibacillus patelloidae]|uniref:Atypical membrane-integrating protein (Mistic protein) n=1 Tax=Lottiidibacillus patelloidae TaxID=2670334 RepID=A0A263BS01_9BACI|nr:hypothetical protein [Lottiidibacillus patelloidae]OZM56147.1 hypothetical protein CIB95_13655 [Lottiidibacillus patelloidae]
MKINGNENKELSKAIDQITEGLDTVIELYNESELDEPILSWSEENISKIKRANEHYGIEVVQTKINKIVSEMLDWLPLEEEDEEH